MDLDEIYTESYYGKGPRTYSHQIGNCYRLLNVLRKLTEWVLPTNEDENMHKKPPPPKLYGMYQTIGVPPVDEILDSVCKKPNDELKPFDKLKQHKHWEDILELYLQNKTIDKSWRDDNNFQSDDPTAYDEWFNQLSKEDTELVLKKALQWVKGL